ALRLHRRVLVSAGGPRPRPDQRDASGRPRGQGRRRLRAPPGRRSDGGADAGEAAHRRRAPAHAARAAGGRGARRRDLRRQRRREGGDGRRHGAARTGVRRTLSMAWDFSPTEEQRLLIATVRQFMAEEIFPHEREVERLGTVPAELGQEIHRRSKELGLYAANMPAEVGGGGLDFLSVTLMDRELGKSTWGLMGWVGRPSEILNACQGEQRERYLIPTVAGDRKEAFALTEPNAGSDAMGIQTRAVKTGGDYV